MDFHVITPRGAELVMRTVGGQLVIVPPPIRTLSQVVAGSEPVPAAPAAHPGA